MSHMPTTDQPDGAVAVPNTRAINTTAPIAGGGDLSADRTISLNDLGVTAGKLAADSVTTTKIADNSVTMAKIEDATGARLVGTTGAGSPSYLTGTQATTVLDTFTAGLKGLVPPPGASTGLNALLDDGTWGTAGQTLFYDVTSPTYGATGDGMTDDRVAIQAAIDACSAAGGGVVWFPVGTYRVTRTSVPLTGCLYLKSNVTLMGESRTGSVIKLADNQSTFTRVLYIDTQSYIRVTNLSIDGNVSGQTVPEEHMAGALWATATWLKVDRCNFYDCCGDGMQIYTDCADVLIEDCNVYDNGRAGISMTGLGCARVTISDCQCTGNSDQQIDTEMAGAGTLEDILIRGCHLVPNSPASSYALTCSGYDETHQANGFVVDSCIIESAVYIIFAKQVRFINNRVEVPSGNNANAVVVDRKCENVTIANNHIYADSADPSSNAAVYVQGTTTDTKPAGVIIEGNYIETTQNASGVRVVLAHSVMVSNNRIVGNSSVASSRAGVSISASEGDPLYQVHVAIVSGNWITDFGRGVLVGGIGGGDADNAIYELQVVNNVLERVNHASMQGLELDFSSGAIADRSTVIGNTGINITTMFSTTTGWPNGQTIVAGNRGDGGLYSGTGSPESVLTERAGAEYIRRDGVGGEVRYRKEFGTSTTGWVEIGAPPNLVRNSGFQLAQRQAPGTPTTYSATAGRAITADGWGASNENASVQYARTDTAAAPETNLLARYYGTYTKITNAGKAAISQVIEATRVAPVRGKSIHLHLRLKASTAMTVRLALVQLTSSGTVDTIPATFVSSWAADGTDPTLGTNLSYITPSGAENGTISSSAMSCSVTTSWQKFGAWFAVPSNCKNLAVLVFSNADMAVSDALSITEVVLSDAPQLWRRTLTDDDMAYCQRFYQKTFTVDTAPAQNAGAGTGELVSALWKAAATANAAIIPWRFHVEMRAAPTITTYNPAAANAEVRQTGGTASDLTATASGNTTAVQTEITATGVGTGAVGDRVAIHASADAEL